MTARLQRKGGSPSSASPEAQHTAADAGTQGPRQALPYADEIQRCFGFNDLGAVGAFVGGPATTACDQLGARAYASGDAVAFASAPDLHTAAHEAAHVVQQRGGVQLEAGLGRSGDAYEQQADAVADAVVAGRSAEGLLAGNGTGGHSPVVQRKEAGPGVPKGGRALHRSDPAAELAAIEGAYRTIKAVDQQLAEANVNRWIYDDAVGFVAGQAGAVANRAAQAAGASRARDASFARVIAAADQAPDGFLMPAAPSSPSRLPTDLPAPKPRIDFEAETRAIGPAATKPGTPKLTPDQLKSISKALRTADKTFAILGLIGGAKNIHDGLHKLAAATTAHEQTESLLLFEQGVLGILSGSTALAGLSRFAGVSGFVAAALQLRSAGSALLKEQQGWRGKDSIELGQDTFDEVTEHAGPVAGVVAGTAVTLFAACGEIVWGVVATLRDVGSMLDSGVRLIMAPADELKQLVDELFEAELRPEHWRDHTAVAPQPDVPRPAQHRPEPGALDGLDDREAGRSRSRPLGGI